MIYNYILVFLLGLTFSKRIINHHDHHHIYERSCSERPELENNIISPSGNFKIHYNNYYDGIESFSYEVALAADSSRRVIVEEMNFRSEVQDNDGIYDIYIKQLPNGSYGWNCLESDNGSSWIEIDDNYIGSNYSTSGFDAMRISIAHEFFHAIQRSYITNPGSISFFFELSSMWIEDLIYPNVNDYINFSQIGDDYFDNPTLNLSQYNGYGLGLYGHYLNNFFGSTVMQDIWNELSNQIEPNVYEAINHVLSFENSTFAKTWIDFNVRNIFNGHLPYLNNQIYYYDDQIYFNPINTIYYDLSDYLSLVNNNYFNENFTYEINSNNKSIDLRSFYTSQPTNQELLFDINLSNGYTFLAIKSANRNEVIDITNQDYINIFDNDDNFSLFYISETLNEVIETSISKKKYNPDYNLKLYPNPLRDNQYSVLELNSPIQVDNISIEVINLKGQLVRKLSLGSIDYSLSNNNEIIFSLFDDLISSGIYIVKINLDQYTKSKKIIYFK